MTHSEAIFETAMRKIAHALTSSGWGGGGGREVGRALAILDLLKIGTVIGAFSRYLIRCFNMQGKF